MKKLTKKHLDQQADLAGDLHELAEEIQAAVDTYNAAIETAFEVYQAALTDAYTEHIEPLDFSGRMDEAESFRQDISDQLRTYLDERSDKWQESEAGELYAEWVDAWEALDLSLDVEFDPPEVEAPEPLEVPEIDWESFGALPDSP